MLLLHAHSPATLYSKQPTELQTARLSACGPQAGCRHTNPSAEGPAHLRACLHFPASAAAAERSSDSTHLTGRSSADGFQVAVLVTAPESCTSGCQRVREAGAGRRSPRCSLLAQRQRAGRGCAGNGSSLNCIGHRST